MDFAFSDDQNQFASLAEQIFADHCTDDRAKAFVASGQSLDTRLWSVLAETGIVPATLPAEFGGADLGMIELARLFEAYGQFLAPVPLFASVVLFGLPVAQFGTDAQKQMWLPRLVSGEAVFSGSVLGDSVGLDLNASPEGASWRLNGRVDCVPFAPIASHVLLWGGPAGGRRGFIVGLDDPNLSLIDERPGSGEPQSAVQLDNVRVASDMVLGSGDPAAELWTAERTALAVCAVQLGIAQEALGRTAEYVSQRRQFDRPLSAFQAVTQRIASGYADVAAMRETLYQAAWLMDADRPSAAALHTAKWWSAEAGHRVSRSCQHLHGGLGADISYPIHRYFLWAKRYEFLCGGAGYHLQRLADLLAQPILGKDQ
jgi:alkylation response protein AidB-like acyl-CoA dehydrogenase